MASMKLVTKFDPRICLKLAWRTAQEQGYSLTPIEEGCKRFTAKRGNVIVGLLAGPISPYCCFEICVESYPGANELSLEKNTPWLTSGAIGVSRVNARAIELFDAIAKAIEAEGGTIEARKEF